MEILKLLSHNILISEEKVQEKEIDNYEFEKVEKELLADLKKDMKEKYKDESVFDSPELYINIYFSRLNNTSKKIDREGKTI